MFCASHIASQILLSARMTLVEYALDLLLAYMQIDLRGADRSVSKQFLNYAKVGPVVQEMSGERVAERIRIYFDACAETYFLDAFLNRCAGQWTQADRSNQTV